MLNWQLVVAVVASGLSASSCDSNSSVSTTLAGQRTSVETTSAQVLDLIDAGIPVVAFDGEPLDEPAPYFGAQDASGMASQPEAGFTPDAAYQEFCWAVSVINSRPQPRDEFEEVVVANEYFGAIEPYVVPDLRDDLALLIEFTASIVENGSFTEANEVGDDSDVALALDRINQVVDRECLGRST